MDKKTFEQYSKEIGYIKSVLSDKNADTVLKNYCLNRLNNIDALLEMDIGRHINLGYQKAFKLGNYCNYWEYNQ